MKIKRYHMEDWLNQSGATPFNLSASGARDFYLKDFLSICQGNFNGFNDLFLGDNSTMGTLKLREEICKSYRHVPVDEVMVTNGSSEALFTFFNELLDEGDEVVIPFPAFQCLYQIPISIGCNVKYLHLTECKNRRLDFNRLENLVTPNTRLIIINNPHNPFGWTLYREELQRIGEIAQKNNSFLLFDEHYRYLPLEPGTHLIPSGYDICRKFHAKTYATGSMIKCFGIVGIRIGWLLGEPAFLSRCRDYKNYLTHTIPSLTDHIAYVALKNKENIIRAQKTHILTNLCLLNDFMKKSEDYFEYVQPTGGVVCFPQLKNGMDSKAFCKILLEEYKVSLLPGFAFEVDGYFRLNFGVNSEIFKGALEQIQKMLNERLR